MGILDEAIREHLELKRQHGAADSELKQLEDEAFGAAERPGSEGAAGDALAEAPTEFMAAPKATEEEQATEVSDTAAEAEEAPRRREPASAIGDLQEAPEPSEPAEEEQPAGEHETVEPPEPLAEAEALSEPESAEHEERQAIAEQPTEHFDVEEELASEKRGPSEEELVEEGIVEPRLAPIDPLADAEQAGEIEIAAAEPAAEPEEEEDEDDAFWNEQRLSEELDQALDAPLAEAAPETPEPESFEGVEEEEVDEAEGAEEETRPDSPGNADLLEDTPDFLEDAPEDDELWFEQKPPKDFDFDD